MTKNMGTADRSIRVLAALGIGAGLVTGQLSGTLALVLGAVAIILLLTSTIAWCPAYLPFGFSTRKMRPDIPTAPGSKPTGAAS